MIGDWPVDPTVKMERRGVAPDGHARRCQATNACGLQCKNWARIGAHYCNHHGGHRQAKVYQSSRDRMARNYYSQFAGPRLKDVVKRLSEESVDEQMSLAAEVDAQRLLSLEAFKLWDAAVNSNVDEDLKQAAAVNLRAMLNAVADTVQTASRVYATCEASMSTQAVNYVVEQMRAIVERTIRPQYGNLADTVIRQLGEIRLPQADALPPDERFL